MAVKKTDAAKASKNTKSASVAKKTTTKKTCTKKASAKKVVEPEEEEDVTG